MSESETGKDKIITQILQEYVSKVSLEQTEEELEELRNETIDKINVVKAMFKKIEQDAVTENDKMRDKTLKELQIQTLLKQIEQQKKLEEEIEKALKTEESEGSESA
jgi:hypothetical protein